jgi:hypothetical protein
VAGGSMGLLLRIPIAIVFFKKQVVGITLDLGQGIIFYPKSSIFFWKPLPLAEIDFKESRNN